jgi:NAD(P)-dependent dehydrogenase (short-subunit alcohol dehydrogenase family)
MGHTVSRQFSVIAFGIALMFDLAGKHALVTGGTSGIGLAVASRFRDAGAVTAVSARTRPVEGLGDDLRFVQCDHTRESEVEALFDQVGSLDTLVINAGQWRGDAPLETWDVDALDSLYSVNTRGVALCLKYAARFMRDGGSVIVTSSVAAWNVMPGYASYSASKASILPLVQHAALQLGARGIRVNAVCPGTILSPMQPADDPEAAFSRSMTCLRRAGTPSDLTGVYHFLASDESGFLTAQEIPVDGGWLGGVTPAVLALLADA